MNLHEIASRSIATWAVRYTGKIPWDWPYMGHSNDRKSPLESMLSATFQHIRGIGPSRELDYWKAGVFSWGQLEARIAPQTSLFQDVTHPVALALSDSRRAYAHGDAEYFAKTLRQAEHYRIALAFPDETLFLDIETTGLSLYYDEITLVGWSRAGEYGVFIRGDPLDRLRDAVGRAKAVVTFNGSLFDLPFIRKAFPEITLPSAHVDLRFLGARLGLRGGLKHIEDQLGVRRPADLRAVEGSTAPILWHRYRRGDINALRLLLRYNFADVEAMKVLFDDLARRLVRSRGLPAPLKKTVRPFSHGKKAHNRVLQQTRVWINGLDLPSFRGDSGPKATYQELLRVGDALPRLRVVGIDLSGSALRPSGWCLLDGFGAETAELRTDQELIQQTLAAGPHLVSIDSPLSLPEGRTSVTDDDPARVEYGIMRQCERVLKKRGVNVYPALIPSMQKLTARGIRLAATLRAEGLPVIESYPGAAQDIMNIPRKRASLSFLRQGLAEFGIVGRFLYEQVSHDELDAITAAVVGVFFWSGRFEGLGTSEEEKLIIPDLTLDPTRWRRRLVIGFSGHLAAGKTTAARYVETKGFSYARYSQVLADLLTQSGKEVTRSALQDLGYEMNQVGRQRWLGRRLVERLAHAGDIVIDGLRHPDDHAFMVENFGPGFFHVFLDVPKEMRRERYVQRGQDNVSFDSAETHEVERNMQCLADLAEVIIENNGPVEMLLSNLDLNLSTRRWKG